MYGIIMWLYKHFHSNTLAFTPTVDCALKSTGGVALFFALFTFIASQTTRNFSWVDRLWSLMPVLHAWIILFCRAHEAHKGFGLHQICCTKLSLFVAVVTIWGARLMYDLYRKNGYARGSEDYRWAYVRSWPIIRNSKTRQTIFNLVLISFFQCFLLWAIVLPLHAIPATPICPTSIFFAAMMLVFIAFEALCDQQQRAFHEAKKVSRRGTLAHGFCYTGCFGYSRHLNYFCETKIWLTLAIAAACLGKNVPVCHYAGCIVLEALIMFSAKYVTEPLSLRRYPGYKLYQRTTPMLFPALTSTTEQTKYMLNKGH